MDLVELALDKAGLEAAKLGPQLNRGVPDVGKDDFIAQGPHIFTSVLLPLPLAANIHLRAAVLPFQPTDTCSLISVHLL